jgi:uncharacterized cupredoxin-like copper-binding protein
LTIKGEKKMKSRRIVIFIGLFLLTAIGLSACSQKPIDAALTTYGITLDNNTAKAGDITFHVHNDATDLTHEFVVFKTDLPEDQLPLTADGIVDEEADGVTAIDEVEDVEPGQSVDLTVTLDPGKYVLVCNVDSDEQHYMHGMHVAFTVN